MKKSITESQLRSIIRQTIEEAIKPWHGADNINVLDNLSLADAGVSYDETPLEPGELSMMAQDEDPNINSIARDPMNWASLPKDYVEKTVSEAIKKTLQETPQFEKGWNDDMKRERRTANFVDDTFGKGTNPYDIAPELANAIDISMNKGRIGKHKALRGVKKLKNESLEPLISQEPSPLEEEFQDAFCGVIDQYAQPLLSQGYHPQELANWCCEMVNEIILQ